MKKCTFMYRRKIMIYNEEVYICVQKKNYSI